MVLRFAHRFHIEPRIAGQGILEFLERASRLEPAVNSLVGIATTVGRLQHGSIHPDLRFGHAAGGFENADHGPLLICNLDRRADIQTLEFALRTGPDDHFVQTPFKHSPTDDTEFTVHRARLARYAAQRNVGVRAGGAFRQVDDHEQLRRDQGAGLVARDTGRLGDIACIVAAQTAHHFRSCAASQHHDILRLRRILHGLHNTLGDGQYAHHDRNDTRDSKHGRGR